MLHRLRVGDVVFCTNVDSFDESLPNRPKLHEFYTVRANCFGRGILLKEVINKPCDLNEGELGFPQSGFVRMDNERTRKMIVYSLAANKGGA